jgi:MFS family permease
MESTEQEIRWYDYITINNIWFAIAVRSQVMTPLVLPLLIQQFVGDEAKGAYYGGLRLWGLMVALLVQSVMGVLSDHFPGRWGRRRVFIAAGLVGEILALCALLGILDLHSVDGFWLLFLIYFLSNVASNTAQAGANGLIPDLVPDVYKSKFSAVKSLFDLPLSLIFFAFVISRVVKSGNLSGAILILAAVNGVCLLVTLLAPEKPITLTEKVNWGPILRLALMVAVFSGIILSIGALVRSLVALLPHNQSFSVLLAVGAISLAGMGLAIILSVGSGITISLGRESLKDLTFARWLLNRLAFFTGTSNLGGFLVFFLQSKFTEMKGIQAAQPVFGLVMVTGVSILLATLPSGWLCDRFGKKAVILASALLVTAGVVVMVSMNTLVLIAAGGAMIGIGTGLFYTASWALGTSIVPKSQAGLYLGLASIAGAGAGAIGAYIGGPVGDQFGYSLLMMIYGTIVLFSGLAFFGPDPGLNPVWFGPAEQKMPDGVE